LDKEAGLVAADHRADQLNTSVRADLDARDVIKRAQNNGG
jgi:hypothetical protein